LKAIFVVFVITTIFLGAGLKLSEGVLLHNNPTLNPTGFEEYNNCFWCVFITMSTIGYGDYFPKTLLGRAIIFATALIGIVLSSLLIVSLSAYLEMQAS
jgi:potassium intermediate/small conductance calcium-activated channel subfamily N protein 2